MLAEYEQTGRNPWGNRKMLYHIRKHHGVR